MSNLTVTNINGADVDTGKVKAWATMMCQGAVSITDSMNASSMTDVTTGRYSLSFASPFASPLRSNTSGYMVNQDVGIFKDDASNVETASTTYFAARGHSNAYIDPAEIDKTLHGDLA